MKKAFWKLASPVLTQIWFGFPFFMLGVYIFGAIEHDPSMGTTAGFIGMYALYFILPIVAVILVQFSISVIFVFGIPIQIIKWVSDKKNAKEGE